jgi:hypothetical protein
VVAIVASRAPGRYWVVRRRSRVMTAEHITRDQKGRLKLELTFDTVTYGQFDLWAQQFLSRHDGVVTRKIDGPDARVWDVTIRGEQFLLVFDDFPLQTLLIAETSTAERVLCEIGDAELHLGPAPADTMPLAAGEFRCLRCRCVIQSSDHRCSVCGWTWIA